VKNQFLKDKFSARPTRGRHGNTPKEALQNTPAWPWGNGTAVPACGTQAQGCVPDMPRSGLSDADTPHPPHDRAGIQIGDPLWLVMCIWWI